MSKNISLVIHKIVYISSIKMFSKHFSKEKTQKNNLVLFCYYNNDNLENINIIKIISNIKYLLRNIDFSYYDNDFNSNYKLKRQ